MAASMALTVAGSTSARTLWKHRRQKLLTWTQQALDHALRISRLYALHLAGLEDEAPLLS